MQIQVNEKIYLKDPNSSELGKNIVGKGASMIDEIGLEGFTFRKLAKELQTTESSIYRYFESKHMLLIYLTSWYWGWMEYQLVFSINNIPSPEERLRLAIKVLAQDSGGPTPFEQVDINVLNRILISESSKAYLTKEVDEENKVGLFAGYQRLVKRMADIVLEIGPSFAQAHTLISTIIEGIHSQKYFAAHLPALTDFKKDTAELSDFYSEMALAIIKTNK